MSKPSEIDEAFRLLDRNGDGHISAAEMREFLDKMGTDVVSKVSSVVRRDSLNKRRNLFFCRLIAIIFRLRWMPL
jgi:Ca2+-binding EF-hand superfamily protein